MNITYDSKAKEIVIRVPYDDSGNYPVSKSGKTNLAASTGGFVTVAGCKAKIGLNVLQPKG